MLDKYVLEHFLLMVNAAYWNDLGTVVLFVSLCLLTPLKFAILNELYEFSAM